MGVRLLIGTDKGLFIATADDARKSWTIDPPQFKGWKVTASARDRNGRSLLGTASMVYGPAVHVSDDLKTWKQIEDGPAWNGSGERKLNQIWTINADHDRYYLGVDEAGLFSSADGGQSWQSVESLNEHETRRAWQPGAGGLCLHKILIDPQNPDRIWVGISAVGVFRSEDGGRTWQPKNSGVRQVLEDKEHKDVGFCVHDLALDPDDSNRLYRREHVGMFRSTDGGESWQRNETGLSSWFGFPIAMDRNAKTLYCVPLESDEYRMPPKGKLEVFRSTDRGDTWQSASNGLPAENAYTGVLRGAMDVDHQNPCGVYFGTTSGEVYISNDNGDTWSKLPATLPRVMSVQALVD